MPFQFSILPYLILSDAVIVSQRGSVSCDSEIICFAHSFISLYNGFLNIRIVYIMHC